MTKYYRVRTQEQWDWLKNKLEIKGDLHVSYFPVTILDGDVFCGIYKYHDDPEPLIEVSQMMGESRMEDYVTIQGKNVEELKNEQGDSLFYMVGKQRFISSFMEDYECSEVNIPKSLLYPKVPMTGEGKKEFDKLPKELTIFELLTEIREAFDSISGNGVVYPVLKGKLFDFRKTKETQKAIVLAYLHPDLIEVIPEKKFNVKVPVANGPTFYYKTGDGVDVCKPSPTMQNLETTRFTAEEIKQYGLDNDLFEKIEVGK